MTWYLVNGDVYMEHRFLKKTLKLEEGRIFVLPPDTRPEEGAHIYNAAGKKIVPGFMEDDKHLEYGIYLGGQMIGFVNDCGVDGDEIEIGYVIHPRYQGHGYATEAVRAVIGELREMGFRKIVAGYFSENTASFRVMEKCGMQQLDRTEVEEDRGEKHICRYCELCFF